MRYILRDEKIKQNCIKEIEALYGVYEVVIKPYKKDRSAAQNRLMWEYITTLADYTGNSKDDMHEILKLRFLGSETITALGYKIERPRSTTKLTTAEFTDYLDKIDALAIQLGVRLPKPEDLYYEAMG